MDGREETLRELLRIEQENNRMLRNLRSSMRWGHFFSILKWIIVLGVIAGAYIYVEPYVAKFIGYVSGNPQNGQHISQAWQQFFNTVSSHF